MDKISFICPQCKKKLKNNVCSACLTTFEKQGNITFFSRTNDSFYENKFTSNKDSLDYLPRCLPLTVKQVVYLVFLRINLVLRYQRFFCHHLNTVKRKKPILRILDLACGGGNSFLKRFGEVHGLDISRSSVIEAAKHYDYCYTGDIYRLPFDDKTFDVITSFDLVEHIPEDRLEQFTNEIRRVMVDDGISLHYLVADSQCCLGRFIKRYPELYQKYFVEKDGHHGLHTATDLIHRLSADMTVYDCKSIFARIVMPLGYVNYFDNEYAEKNVLVKLFVTISKTIVKHNWLHCLASVFLYPIYILCDTWKTTDEGFNLLIALRKKH